MIATIINCLLIVLGSACGLLLKGKLPQRFLTVLTQALGLCVVGIGMTSAIATNNTLCVVVCLVIGTILGEAINIEKRLDTVGESLRKKFEKNAAGSSTFTEGFVSASVLFCVGAMAIVGSINAGIHGDYAVLISKSVIDGVTAVSMTSVLGIGVAFSALPILLYQGGLTLLAGLVAPFLQQAVITEMSAVGGCIIVGIGLNMLDLPKDRLRVGNMLPAIFLPLVYLPLASYLTQIFHNLGL
ncbi:MAG: DUF554 domain-containing protein [Ruminiclostridium sp.]|nr:DUF554 domain-containing protein [Ruminiclostridium sp.]